MVNVMPSVRQPHSWATDVWIPELVRRTDSREAACEDVRRMLDHGVRGPDSVCRHPTPRWSLDFKRRAGGSKPKCCGAVGCCALHFAWHLSENHELPEYLAAYTAYALTGGGIAAVHYVGVGEGKVVVDGVQFALGTLI